MIIKSIDKNTTMYIYPTQDIEICTSNEIVWHIDFYKHVPIIKLSMEVY